MHQENSTIPLYEKVLESPIFARRLEIIRWWAHFNGYTVKIDIESGFDGDSCELSVYSGRNMICVYYCGDLAELCDNLCRAFGIEVQL